MPCRPRRPDQPTVYLDHSTWCYAHFGRIGAAGNGTRPDFDAVADWIERQSRNINICVSSQHIIELAAWPNRAEALRVAQWIDDVETVAVRAHRAVVDDEIDDALLRRPASPHAWAPSLLTMFHPMPSGEVAADLLRNPRLAPFVAARPPQANRGLDQLSALSRARLRDDRARADLHDLSLDERRRRLRINRLVTVRDLALLRSAALGTSWAEVSRVIDAYEAEPRLLPSLAAMQALYDGFVATVERRKHDTVGDRELNSSLSDIEHAAVGGAYCDVFVCDALTAAWLNPTRQALGRQPCLVLRKPIDNGLPFLAALKEQLLRIKPAA